MLEQAANRPVEIGHKPQVRRLHGFWLWVSRGAYFLLLAMIVTFFIAGFKDFINSWTIGGIGASVYQDASGKLILQVARNSDADTAGILNGDYLEAVNNIPVSTAAGANKLLVGRMGDTVTLTVLTRHQFPRTVQLTYAGSFLQMLSQMNLSPRFLIIYHTVFSSMLLLGVTVCSLLVFFRRSNDWLAILMAYSMIAFASLFISPTIFGTNRWHIFFLTNLMYLSGIASMIIVFFIFPTGHFQPGWTRWMALALVIPVFLDFLNLQLYGNMLFDFYIWILFIILGAYAQIFRYRKVSNPSERQQTKRVVLAAVACFGLIALFDILSILLPAHLTYPQYLLFSLLVKAVGTIPILILEIGFVFAIYRYRLWDTDLYISRTILYTIVTFFLLLVWIITTQVLNYASQELLNKQVGWLSALVSGIQIAVIYKPVRAWAEKWVNKRFYKDRIDYDKALVELHPTMWGYMTPLDLVHTLVTKVPELLQSTSSAMFLQERSGLVLQEVQNIHPSEAHKFQFTPHILKKLEKGEAIHLPEGEPFKLLVPLTIPRLQVYDLVGILAMGPRTKGRGYSRDHLTDLTALGRSAGTALHMLELNEKKLSKGMAPTALPPG